MNSWVQDQRVMKRVFQDCEKMRRRHVIAPAFGCQDLLQHFLYGSYNIFSAKRWPQLVLVPRRLFSKLANPDLPIFWPGRLMALFPECSYLMTSQAKTFQEVERSLSLGVQRRLTNDEG